MIDTDDPPAWRPPCAAPGSAGRPVGSLRWGGPHGLMALHGPPTRGVHAGVSRSIVVLDGFYGSGKQAIGRHRVLVLAAGPFVGALVGVVTNVLTGEWNWWLVAALVGLVAAASLQVVLVDANQPIPVAGSVPAGLLSTALRRFNGYVARTELYEEPACKCSDEWWGSSTPRCPRPSRNRYHRAGQRDWCRGGKQRHCRPLGGRIPDRHTHRRVAGDQRGVASRRPGQFRGLHQRAVAGTSEFE